MHQIGQNLQLSLIEIEAEKITTSKYISASESFSVSEDSISAMYDGVREKEMEKLVRERVPQRLHLFY